MPVKISKIVHHTLTIPVEGSDDLVVKYKRPSVRDLDKMRENLRVAGKEDSKAIEDNVEFTLLPCLSSWNIEDDEDKPVPITTSFICTELPVDWVLKMLDAINEKPSEKERPNDSMPTSSTTS